MAGRCPQARFTAVTAHLGPPDGDNWKGESDHREYLTRAWLAPMLLGSAVPVRRGGAGEPGRLGPGASHPAAIMTHSPISLEIALAQGFKHAANRRPQHRHARKDAPPRSYLAERAAAMLEDARFWYSRVTLVQALCLWALPATPGTSDRTAKRARRALLTRGRVSPARAPQGPRGRGTDPGALVGHWLESRIPGQGAPVRRRGA